MLTKKKMIIGAATIIFLLLSAIGLVIWNSLAPSKALNIFGSGKNNPITGTKDTQKSLEENMSKDAAKETQTLIEELKEISSVDPNLAVNLPGQEGAASGTPAITGIRVAPGASIVNTATGDVVDSDGKKLDNSAPIGSLDAPRQSKYIQPGDKIPESAVKLEIGADFIKPNEFKVKAGQAVSLAIFSVSKLGALFRFEDASLRGVTLSLMPDRAKIIVFNAPDEPGEYAFYSDHANQRTRGAVGKMIVE
jgi:hypothetical protein